MSGISGLSTDDDLKIDTVVTHAGWPEPFKHSCVDGLIWRLHLGADADA